MLAKINDRWELELPEHRAEFHIERPWWEAPRLSDMFERLGDKDTLIDVGSEEGDLTALYASWGPRVHYIDPSEYWRQQTIDIFKANNLARGISFIGFAADYTDLTPTGSQEADGFAHLNERSDIPRVTLDYFATWLPKAVTALMIDVEGSELSVLRGALGILDDHRPTVWVSVHPDFMKDRYGHIHAELLQLMELLRYDATYLDDHHEVDYRFDPR
jgi:FkbM family methyltransferase